MLRSLRNVRESSRLTPLKLAIVPSGVLLKTSIGVTGLSV